jgi:hypothetical protein
VTDPTRSATASVTAIAPLASFDLDSGSTTRLQNATVLVTATAGGGHTPLTISLQSLDQNGAVFSTLGNLHDDGLNGDLAAGDGIYSLQLALAAEKPGSFRFQLSTQFSDIAGTFTSSLQSFIVFSITELNSTKDVLGSNDGGVNWFQWNTVSPNVASELVFSSQSTSGPWQQILSRAYNVGEVPPATPSDVDPDVTAPSRDMYYVVRAYDKANQLLHTFAPVFLPRYDHPDNPQYLGLRGSPLVSVYLPTRGQQAAGR